MKLAGLKVVEFAHFQTAPYVCTMMADHGAEVVKVEPLSGDLGRGDMRLQGPEPRTSFRLNNRGKRSLAVDLKSADGLKVAWKLIESADVIVEAYRPGAAEKLGIGYGEVSRRVPRIVYCSITPFGHQGPLSSLPAHNTVVEALSGTLALGRDGVPVEPNVVGAIMAGTLTAFAGIMMAVLRARETGQGDYVDISMSHALMAQLPNALADAVEDGWPPVPNSTNTKAPPHPLSNFYETADGAWIVINSREPKFAHTLLTALGRPDFIELARGGPGPDKEPLRAYLVERFGEEIQDHWIGWFSKVDVPFAPILDFEEALLHPQTGARGMLIDNRAGRVHIASPIQYLNEPSLPHASAPRLGEDGAEVLQDLGYNQGEIDALAVAGVVHCVDETGSGVSGLG